MINVKTDLIKKAFQPVITESVREQLTVSETDNTFSRSPSGRRSPRSGAEGMTLDFTKEYRYG
jgi:hypothetical protein